MPVSRSAQLCWGQHYHLLRYHQVPEVSRHEAHIKAEYPLPDGCTTEHVRRALNHLVRRHEGLRTVYDLDAHPWPLQRVEPPAPLPLHEATTEDDGTPPPAEVIRRLSDTAFDITRDWPLRACAVTTGGRLKRLHLVFNHLSFDDVSLDVLCHDLDAVLAARTEDRPVILAPVAQQPVDLARYEAARPAGVVEAALDHWRGEVRRLPDDVFLRRRDPHRAPGAAHAASFTVPSLLATARAVAARHRVWPSAVHLAAYAVTLAAYTGERAVAHRMYTSQRDASGFPSVLTCMSYPTPAVLDLRDDPPFSTVLRRAADRVGQAMAHAHIPYDRLLEFIAQEGLRRGRPVRVASELNFLDNAPLSCRTRRDRFTWNAAPTDWTTAASDLYFRVYEWSDGITLALQAVEEVMDRDAAERFLRGYARLLAAHADPGTDLTVGQAAELAGFTPAAERPLLAVAGQNVDAEQTAAALREHPGVRSVTVRHDDRGLVADVVADRPVTPALLRTHALGAAHDRPGARCPDWFRVSDAGRRLPPVEGDGSPAAPRPPADSQAERDLLAVTAEANGLRAVDPADSYAAAGGRALRMPRVLAALRARGWEGLTIDLLGGARPLHTLTDRMRRSGHAADPGPAGGGRPRPDGGGTASPATGAGMGEGRDR
ncbi:condensation domain-containing protein [Streptantibioticus silvisoli]|uniref:Condensation domain-containing protein n=1 Tax=Streptantibioticus silvisoli TaxID=2705255 RepID=A0ABT6W4H9_9ACTN|nr:condensation domain-containing protein [Streptantibioticus silvisoli]MDI5964578.1 condensation domain-containing protein [Streptantibioticus silvisoli]